MDSRSYEVLAGNTQDKATLRDFLRRIEAQHGKIGRTWIMDRGIPTEEVLAEMRASETPMIIWWARRADGSAGWSKASYRSLGTWFATLCRQNWSKRTVSFTFWPAAAPAAIRKRRYEGGA
jgi:hypothetical protein